MIRDSPIADCVLLALVLLIGCGVSQKNGTADHHHVILTWNASSGATRYNIYRSEISGGYYGLIGSTAQLTFRDEVVNSGATYYYVCTAVDSAGRESEHSNEVLARIPFP